MPGEYKEMPGERMGVGAKCHGNAAEYRGMSGERMRVGVNCQGNARNAGECQGKCLVPVECRGLPGECKGVGVKC